MSSFRGGGTGRSGCLCRSMRRGEGYDDKWALGFPAVLGWTVWISGFTVSTVALIVFQLFQAWQRHGTNRALLIALLTSRSALVVASLLSCGSYLCVATRRPRPRELHLHGLVLLLIVPEVLGNQSMYTVGEARVPGGWLLDTLKYIPWGVRRVLFVGLVLRKISALGPPESGCLGPHKWGPALKLTLALQAFLMVVYTGWEHIMKLRGVSADVLESRFSLHLHPGMTVADLVILKGSTVTVSAASIAWQAMNFIFVCTCRRSIRKAEMKLVARAVHGEMRTKVQRKLRRHFVAICLSLLTTHLTMAASIVDLANVFREDREKALNCFCHMIDVLGDMVSILLLSGIGLLLRREDPDAGDISAHIRSLLHSAVLTGRVDVVFEGAVIKTEGNFCVASFPGKFLKEWRSLTWHCEQQLFSSACVFLPRSDPEERYGRHVECPDTPGHCWCYSLYGDNKPWGCAWFCAWKSNIERAVELGLDLVVTFFPGQTGKGMVPWSSLATSDLWDGVGLGGSQKAEVAFLRKQGYAFLGEDLEDTRLRLSKCTL